MPFARQPRFKRSTEVPSIRVTRRDREIIERVFEHRFLRSTHLHSLLGGSRQQLLRRLQWLFHHGYLDRPRTQIDYYRSGSRAMVYGLGHRGAGLLEAELEIPHGKVEWTTKNRTVTRYFLEHTLAVADVMIALESACRRHDGVELVLYGDTRDEPLKWSVRVQHGGRTAEIGVVPDKVFGLRFANSPEITWFFLEADRATMPVHRHNLQQTSFSRKLLAYHETWRRGLMKNRFPRFRVLTVTTSPERVEDLIEANRALTQGKGSGLFLFTDKITFASVADALTIPMLNGRGETVWIVG